MAEASDKPENLENVKNILQEAQEILKGLLEQEGVEAGQEKTVLQVLKALDEIKCNLNKEDENGVLSKAMEYFHAAKAAYDLSTALAQVPPILAAISGGGMLPMAIGGFQLTQGFQIR